MAKCFVKAFDGGLMRRGFVVCCGPKDDVRRLFLDPKTFEGFKAGHRAVQETWAFLSDYWDRTIGDRDNPALGATAQHMGDVFVLMPEWDFSVFVHEAFHATHEALRIMNTDDEEFGAYIIEWLYEQMYWTIHDKTGKGDKRA